MKNRDKNKLLEDNEIHKHLSSKELFNLCIWEVFNKNKINAFYQGLNNGKYVKFAYQDAKNI